MSWFTFPWTISGMLLRPLRPVLTVILIWCGLHVALNSAPRLSRWIFTPRTLRNSTSQPRIRGETIPDVDTKASSKENVISVVGDIASSNRDHSSWLDFFPLSFLWRRSRPRDQSPLSQDQTLPSHNQSPPPPAEYPIHILHDDNDAAIE